MNIIIKSVDEIKPYSRNAKKHSAEQVRNVAESIKQFGFVQPLVVNGGGYIVIGHCRFEAGKMNGMTEFPCVVVDNLTDEQVKKLRIIDNKLNESQWDKKLLEIDIEDLDFSDFDIDFGFGEEKEEVQGRVQFSEVLNEEHNYIVLYFDNDIDWLQAQTLLDLPKVKALVTNRQGKESKGFKRVGQARVLKGSEAIRKIREA